MSELNDIQFGKIPASELGDCPANSITEYTLTFPHTFAGSPTVITVLGSTSTSATIGGLIVVIGTVSAETAVIRVANNTSTTRAPGVYWLAIY